jgi:hypothetical protein
MFARTVPSSTQLIEFCLVVFEYYHWKQAAFIFNEANSALAVAMEAAMLGAGIAVQMRFAAPFQGSATPALPELRRKNVRIIVFMQSTAGDLRQWLLDLFDAGMTGLGWAFFGARITSPDEIKGISTWMGEDNRDADVMKAANGMIASTPAPPASMVGLVGLLQKAALWDMQEYGAEALPLSQWSGSSAVYAGFAYDALQALAIAADAEIRAGGDAANGTSLMQRLLDGTTFDGVMGRVSLDNQGDNMHPW